MNRFENTVLSFNHYLQKYQLELKFIYETLFVTMKWVFTETFKKLFIATKDW